MSSPGDSTPPPPSAVDELASLYAAELQAQFRRLNLFGGNTSEIGRAHEDVLRSVLRRLLPGRVSIDTGFVAFPGNQSSAQIDLLLHDNLEHAALFRTGDCVVASHDAVIAGIEVKTRAKTGKQFISAYRQAAEMPGPVRVLYIWEGPTLKTAEKAVMQYLRDNPVEAQRFPYVVNMVIVRGRFFLMAAGRGQLTDPLFQYKHIREKDSGDGNALLVLANLLYGVAPRLSTPWWLDHLSSFWTDGTWEYPPDILARLQAEQDRRHA